MTTTPIQLEALSPAPQDAASKGAANTAPATAAAPQMQLPGSQRLAAAQWLAAALVFVALATLSVLLWYAEEHLSNDLLPRAARAILVGGLLAAVLLAAAVFYILRSRSRWMGHARRHLDALQVLNRLSAAISARPGSGNSVLADLTEASRTLLGMDHCGIAMFDPVAGTLQMLAQSGHMPEPPPPVFPLTEFPGCRAALSSGTALFAEDLAGAAVPAFPVNSELIKRFGIGALVLIPLSVEGRAIGLMALSHRRPRRFSDADRRLVRLLGAQASVILAEERLYRQMADALAARDAVAAENARLLAETRAALAAEQQSLRQRDALWAIHAEIDTAGTLEQSLEKIVELAAPALGASCCVVSLASDDPDELMVAAMTQTPGPIFVGRRFRLGGCASRTMRERTIVHVRDADVEGGVHPLFRERLNIRSALYLPLLRADGSRLGMLVLPRQQVGGYTEEEVELAKVFSARAARAIDAARLREQTRRLLEQTRRDAEAKAALLRELNHRVKNNLAGIVGLLSIGEPDLPPAARGWLERVIGRIRVMAGAHELFVRGAESVSLGELVARTLGSLAVARPPNVEIRTELESAPVAVRTEQAIGVAMVLHELGYNALVHGLPRGGTLTIRGRNGTTPGELLIEVIDDGVGMKESGARADGVRGTGIGLTLVRGLVQRELKGRFSLGERPGGGTLASVEFPIESAEAESERSRNEQ